MKCSGFFPSSFLRSLQFICSQNAEKLFVHGNTCYSYTQARLQVNCLSSSIVRHHYFASVNCLQVKCSEAKSVLLNVGHRCVTKIDWP